MCLVSTITLENRKLQQSFQTIENHMKSNKAQSKTRQQMNQTFKMKRKNTLK